MREIELGGTIARPSSRATSTPRSCRPISASSASSCATGACRAKRNAAADSSSPAAWRRARDTSSSRARWSERGVIDAKILGQNFLAADIPAANVVLTPDLTLTGDPKGYLLKGDVTIPRAKINLQKLPQDEPPGVSPDVVVIRNGKEVAAGRRRAADSADRRVDQREARRQDRGDRVTGSTRPSAGSSTVRESPGVPTIGIGPARRSPAATRRTARTSRSRMGGCCSPARRSTIRGSRIVAMREINDKHVDGPAHRRIRAAADHHGDLGSERRRGGRVVVSRDGPLAERCRQRERQFAGCAGVGHALARRRGRGTRGETHRRSGSASTKRASRRTR